jgi:PRTRC genetic system protein E
MFTELMPLIRHRPLTLTVAAVDETQIRVNIIPKPTDKDQNANKGIGYSHDKEVAKIPESAITALTTPLSLTGTPAEIDAQLAKTLTEFTALHVGLQNTLNTAAAAISDAVKTINERERIKKEQKNKKTAPSNSDGNDAKADKNADKREQEEGLPSLFTSQPSPVTAVSANDPKENNRASAVENSEPMDQDLNKQDEEDVG